MLYSEDNMSEHDAGEKGFNDDELKDIMDEIENLEKEFSDEPAPAKAEKKDDYIQADKLDDIQGDVDKEVDNILDDKPSSSASKVTKMPSKKKHTGSDSKLQFNVQGNMTVELNFEVSGKAIFLYVNEEEGLVVEVEDGGKFSLPVGSKAA
jgi:hypothetical protein